MATRWRRCGGQAVVEKSLAQLRALALMMPRPGCEWESRPTFAPPTTPATVAAFERAAGFPLPDNFRAFLAATGEVVGISVHHGYRLGGVETLVRWLQDG